MAKMIRLRVRHDIDDFDPEEGPTISQLMVEMAGEEFDYPLRQWEHHLYCEDEDEYDEDDGDIYVQYKYYTWMLKWLEVVDENSILNQGEEL